MTTILLARHGETDWNREGRFQGRADPPLNDTGRAQACALADELADLELAAVYSSPLRRAFETAEVLAATHRLPPVALDALREVDVGSWQGLTREQVESRFPQQFADWMAYDQGWRDGESYEEMATRVVAALLRLAGEHHGERILAVTHGGPIRATLAFADGSSYAEARRRGPPIGNAFLAEFAVENRTLRRLD